MRWFVLCAVLLLQGSNLLALEISGSSIASDTAKQKEEHEAYYPEGSRALYMYLYKNMEFSEEAKQDSVRGELEVSFFVNEDSTVSDVQILNPHEVACGCHDQIPGLLKEKKFVPAKERGEVVRSTMYIKIPIKAQ